MTRILPLAIPLRGLNTVDPTVPFDSGYARELTNYSIANGRLTMRPAVRSTIRSTSFSNKPIFWFDYSGAVWYALIFNAAGDVANLNTGATPASFGSPPADQGQPATVVKHVSLTLLIGHKTPLLAAYPFTAWSFTMLAIAEDEIVAGVSHKGRLYVCNGTTIEYSSIGQITGAMFGSFPVSSFLDGQLISRLFSVSVQPGDSTENVFVIMAKDGRVLIYEGEYPGSATWRLIGKYDMPAPLSRISYVEVSGDIFVATTKFGYWIRDLFSGGAQSAYDNSPTQAIENLWQTLDYTATYTDSLQSVAQCFYISGLDAIAVYASALTTSALTSCFDYESVGGYLVYFRKYKAWAFWVTTPFYQPVREISGVLHGVSQKTEILQLSYTHAVDEYDGTGNTVSIETSWKTPFAYPFAGKNQKSAGIRPFFKNTVSGYLHRMRSIFDFTDYNAPFGFYAQENVTAINPANSSGFSKIDLTANSSNHYQGFVGIGGSGGGVSYQVTQKIKTASSATQTQDIYALTAYVEDGGDMI